MNGSTVVSSPVKALQIAVVPAALALGVLAYQAQVDNIVSSTPGRALATLAYAWTFIGAGLVAWVRRKGHRLGPLMIVVGFAMLLRQFRYSFDAATFTVFYAVGDLAYVLFTHAVLAYPTGRVADRLERAYLVVAYAVAFVFPFSILLFYDGSPLRFFDSRPHESLLLVNGHPDLVLALLKTYAVVAYGVLALWFIALIFRRLLRATPRARRILAPLLVAALRLAPAPDDHRRVLAVLAFLKG